jgi:hypothetical protein
MVGHFHHGGFHPPEIGQGFGHFNSDGPGSDNHRLSHFSLGNFILDIFGTVKV